MLQILRLVRTALELLRDLGQPVKALLLPPFLTVAMLLFLYAGWHVRDEGSISDGLHAAFVEISAYRMQKVHEIETVRMQEQLRRTVATDRIIDQLLATVMQQMPTAARVRLGVIHNGITGLTGTALLRFDITNGVAARGRVIGPLITNEPLSDWSDFLPTLLSGKCHVGTTGGEANLTRRVRLESLGVGAFMACPVIDGQARLLGAVLATWDVRDSPPAGSELRTLIMFTANICVQIAAALDLDHDLSQPMHRVSANE